MCSPCRPTQTRSILSSHLGDGTAASTLYVGREPSLKAGLASGDIASVATAATMWEHDAIATLDAAEGVP